VGDDQTDAHRPPERADDPLAAYDYHLPPELIAQQPSRRRAMARLLVLPLAGKGLRHVKVAHLTRLLQPGDLLVLNDTRVVPARLEARKSSGGKVEVLLLSPARPYARLADGGELHQVLLGSHRPVTVGQELFVRGEERGAWLVKEKGRRGRALVQAPGPVGDLLEQEGFVPLPPYIKRPQGPDTEDRCRYQTVYAKRSGAVAAPTAGLHFTPALLAALQRRGVRRAAITLHVGYGTFAEPAPEDLAAGRLHAEWVEIPEETAKAVAETKAAGGRVVAVGTTSTRALEWRAQGNGALSPGQGWCDLLIHEGRPFKVVDGLLTNFHLPRTTLLMLVAALAGRERVLAAYEQAVRQKYRFYSYGDAMLLL
jgi:S-adenosylmethionine:tRNA ribosyltransferase-isomerase